jgi:hypothetical protein
MAGLPIGIDALEEEERQRLIEEQAASIGGEVTGSVQSALAPGPWTPLDQLGGGWAASLEEPSISGAREMRSLERLRDPDGLRPADGPWVNENVPVGQARRAPDGNRLPVAGANLPPSQARMGEAPMLPRRAAIADRISDMEPMRVPSMDRPPATAPDRAAMIQRALAARQGSATAPPPPAAAAPTPAAPPTPPPATQPKAAMTASANKGSPSAALGNAANQTGTEDQRFGAQEMGLRGQLAGSQTQADEEATRARRLRIAGLVIGSILPRIGAPIMAGSGLVSREGRDGVARNQELLSTLLQQRQAARDRTRQTGLDEQAEANRQRQIELEQDRNRETNRHNSAMEGIQGDRADTYREGYLRGRRGGAGAGGGTGGTPRPGGRPAHPVTAEELVANPYAVLPAGAERPVGADGQPAYSAAERQVIRSAEETGQDPQVALERAAIVMNQARLRPAEQHRLLAEVIGHTATSADRLAVGAARVADREEEEDTERTIPGWRVADPERFRLQGAEARSLRQLQANYSQARGNVRRVMEIQHTMTPADYTSLRTGTPTAKAAELLRLSRAMQTYLRKADAMGVPTGNELEEARQQAPDARSWQMFVAGGPSFAGLMRALNTSHGGYMRGYGLEPDRGDE